MARGHANIAAVGTATLNSKWNTTFKTSYKKDDVHAEVAVLKQNLRDYRALYPANSPNWTGVPSLNNNTSTTFDANTETVLKKFQSLEGLTSDGIYGQGSRNRMAAKVGVSPKGFVRVSNGTNYINYNDTSGGLSGDSEYRLDHSWVTPATRNIIVALADAFYAATSKKLEINDCSLIDGTESPEHNTHKTGKEIDVRNAGLTAAQEKAFLKACIDHADVQRVIFHTKHSLSDPNGKIETGISGHDNHFHVDTKK